MATKTKKKMTANAGASIQRSQLLAKLRQIRGNKKNLNTVDLKIGYDVALDKVASWVKGSAARASKKRSLS